MDKRTAAPLSGRAAPQGVDGSDETDQGTFPEKRVKEADGTGQAVQEVGGCDYPSLLPVVSLVPVKKVIETAKADLHTGEIGDGKVFVYDIENVVKIRTGEEGYLALQDTK